MVPTGAVETGWGMPGYAARRHLLALVTLATGRGLSGGYWELWEQRVNPYPIVDKQESIEGLLSASHHVGSRYMSCPLRGHEVSELSGFSFSFFKALLKYNRYTENTHI